MDVIPQKYILFQWIINVRFLSSATLKTVNELQTSIISPFVLYFFQSAVYRISNSIHVSPNIRGVVIPLVKVVDEFDHLSLMVTFFKEQIIQSSVTGVTTEISKTSGEQIPQVALKDTSKVKSKGCSKTSKRLKSSLEINMSS